MAEIGNVTVMVDAVITDEQYSEAMGAVRAANERMDRLESENAKLRELVADMYTCLEYYEPDGSVGCEHCPLDNDTGNCDYERRLNELGVEVDA